jgi:hypothetical protein
VFRRGAWNSDGVDSINYDLFAPAKREAGAGEIDECITEEKWDFQVAVNPADPGPAWFESRERRLP